MSHPETLAEHFADWLVTFQDRSELPSDGNLAVLVAIWMQEGGAAAAATYDAFVRTVVLLTVRAGTAGQLTYQVDGKLVLAFAPSHAADWWMLEPMEFEAAKR